MVQTELYNNSTDLQKLADEAEEFIWWDSGSESKGVQVKSVIAFYWYILLLSASKVECFI